MNVINLGVNQNPGQDNRSSGNSNAKATGDRVKGQVAEQQSKQGQVSADSVKISAEANSLQEAGNKIKNLPDVDQDKVASLKSRIESGAYDIDNARVAEKILNFESDL